MDFIDRTMVQNRKKKTEKIAIESLESLSHKRGSELSECSGPSKRAKQAGWRKRMSELCERTRWMSKRPSISVWNLGYSGLQWIERPHLSSSARQWNRLCFLRPSKKINLQRDLNGEKNIVSEKEWEK